MGQGGEDREEAAPELLPPRHQLLASHHGAHAVTVAVELHQGGESVRQAARADKHVIKSRPRRARHRIEEARAYQLDGQPDTALATLDKAWESAPETIQYNGYARRIVLEETESRQPERRQRASVLAVKLGMLAA